MENQLNDTVIDEQGTNQIVDSSSNQEDIFSEVFNPKSEDPFNAIMDNQVTNEPIVQNEPLSTQPIPDAKGDPNQFEYWQSQADKRNQEMGAMKHELETMKVALTKKEEVVETTPVVVRPVKPVRPSDYNHSEALADPDSMSSQYLTEKDNYMEQMNDYILDRDSIRDAEIQAAQKQQSETKQQQQANQVSPQAQQRQAQLQQRQDKLGIPKPIGVQPGVSVQSPRASNEDELMNAMIGEHEKVNPW